MSEVANETWVARRYTPADREKIFDLYDAVHGKEKVDVSVEVDVSVSVSDLVLVSEVEGSVIV